jgi:predicted nucleotidyltransferase
MAMSTAGGDGLETIQHLVRHALPGCLALYVFGSRAEGTAGPESDLDLAVLVPGTLDPVLRWRLAGDLAGKAGCEVDLVDFRSASTVLQYRILTTGRRLWAVEPAASLYEAFVLSEKTALDEARAGLLEDIRREGTIHGG